MQQQPRLLIPAWRSIAFAPVTEPLIRVVAGGRSPSTAIRSCSATRRRRQIPGKHRFPERLFWAYIVGTVEFVCGLSRARFLTRLVAAPIIGFLVIAIVTYHWQFGFAWENRGIEYPLFWSIVVLHFLVRGGGPWSLDALIGREL